MATLEAILVRTTPRHTHTLLAHVAPHYRAAQTPWKLCLSKARNVYVVPLEQLQMGTARWRPLSVRSFYFLLLDCDAVPDASRVRAVGIVDAVPRPLCLRGAQLQLAVAIRVLRAPALLSGHSDDIAFRGGRSRRSTRFPLTTRNYAGSELHPGAYPVCTCAAA